MSVQLVIYPQSYLGQTNQISLTPDEFIVDGLNFSSLANATTYESSASVGAFPQDVIDNAFPAIPNTWYSFRSDASVGAVPDYPTSLNGNIRLSTTASSDVVYSGVYQRVTDLPMSQFNSLSITVDDSTSNNAGSFSYFLDQSTPTSNIGTFAGGSTINDIAGAQISGVQNGVSTSTIIMFYMVGASSSILDIKELSLVPQGMTNTGTDFDLTDGQVILDLYEDEDIPLTLSVDNFKNAAEKVQSYSKAFNLPGSKRNSKIFDNIFDITRTSLNTLNFNPYRRTQCVLKQDGFVLFEGYLRMLDITDKNGEVSYNVNLYSEVIAFADVLKDRTFANLPLEELSHDYKLSNIENSWNDSGTGITYTSAATSGFRDAYTTLRYPWVDWNHQATFPDLNALLAGATPVQPALTNLADAFRPWINVKYLIDVIFAQTEFQYSSDFLNTDDFKKLYMDFNWGADKTMPSYDLTTSILQTGAMALDINASPGAPLNPVGGVGVGTTTTVPAGGMATQVGHFYDTADVLGSKWKAQYDGQLFKVEFSYTITSAVALASAIFSGRWRHYDDSAGGTAAVLEDGINMTNAQFNSGFWDTDTFTGINQQQTWSGSFEVTMDKDDILWCDQDYDGDIGLVVSSAEVIITTIDSEIVDGNLLGGLRGELGQWDFLKGIFKMFNLVTMPNPENRTEILIEPYGDIFISDTNSSDTSDLSLATRSITHDWTDKIDISQIKLEPLKDLTKKVLFKYTEDEDDYMFQNYKKAVHGHLYGSLKLEFPYFNILQGTTEVEAEPFAATIMKPYMTFFPGLVTPAIYTMNDDGESSGFENSPRICYNNGVQDLGLTNPGGAYPSSYFVPKQSGEAASNVLKYLKFSHLSNLPTVAGNTKDLNFGACQLVVDGAVAPPDNLYNLYWADYYLELYNPDTRIMKLKVNLNAADVQSFKFNDRVFIKNRTFRVNKIDYKPHDLATVEFILIP